MLLRGRQPIPSRKQRLRARNSTRSNDLQDWDFPRTPISNITLSTDWQRTEWSPSKLDISFDQQGLFLQNQNLDLGWTATSRYRFGAEWRATPAWSFRAGYFRDPAGISSQSAALTNVVSVDQQFFTCGIGFERRHWRLNLGSQYAFGHENFPDRTLKRDNLSALVGLEYFL